MNRLLKVGLSHGSGDKNSYQQIVRLLATPELLELCTPVVFGSAATAAQTLQELGLEPIKWNVINKLQDAAEGKANLYERFEGAADEAVTHACGEGQLQIAVTLTAGGFSAETPEALAALRVEERTYFCPELNDQTTATLLDALRRIHAAMRRDTVELRPRLALILPTRSQLETTVLHDVCRTLHEEGILAFGPFSEEAFEAQQMAAHYDGIVVAGDAECLSRMTAAANPALSYNYLTGLNYVAVSPVAAGHADDVQDSLHCALYSAIDITRTRRSYARATRSPLEKQWNPRGKDDFKLDLTKDVDAD